jgi:hypothetical protein
LQALQGEQRRATDMWHIFNRYTGCVLYRRPKEPMQFFNYGDALQYLRICKVDPTLWEIRKVD